VAQFFEASLRVFLAAEQPYRSDRTTTVWHYFRGVDSQQGRTGSTNFWAWIFKAEILGTVVGVCK
jgi:hypothetical protein